MSRRNVPPRISRVAVLLATGLALSGATACGLSSSTSEAVEDQPQALEAVPQNSPTPTAVRAAAPVPPSAFTPEQIEAARRTLGEAPLDGGVSSLEELGQRVVAGLNARDLEALEALLVTGSEYKERLFLALANHPSALTFGADSSWDMTSRETRDDLRRTLGQWGGRDLSFVRIEPPASQPKPGLVLHRRPALVVRTPGGDELTIAMLGSVVEHEATRTFKLLSYRDAPWHGKQATVAQATTARSE